MEYILVTTMVIGIVELIKRAFDRDYRAAVIIIGATVVGGLCGFFGVEGVSVVLGMAIGIGASGIVTLAQKVSK